jgi:hypothetical protein
VPEIPPGSEGQPPATAAAQYPVYATPTPPASERVRLAWQRRHDTDYIFSFWTALGWSILTCGIYGFYVLYQLVRRSRDHNLRRVELLDAATTLAWEQANARGLEEELRPNFERISANMATLRQQTTQFRDPVIWLLLAIIASGIVHIVVYILLDGDLVTHDYAEGAIESELSTIYGRLGAPVTPPDPSRLKQRHNYVARVLVTLVTFGIYGLWWLYDVMVEGNRHFEHNWVWEDNLAAAVQAVAHP